MSELAAARLWLVRHGQTDWNVAGRVQGQVATELNEVGRGQARELAGYLRGHRFGAVWSSDLPRAWQTAEILAEGRGLAVRRAAGLRERSFGEHEGRTAGEVRAKLGAGEGEGALAGGDLANWTGVEGIESDGALWVRVAGSLRELSAGHAGEDVLVVTHGGVVARVVYEVLGIGAGMPRKFVLSNGLVVVVQWRGAGFHLLSLVDYPLVMGGVATEDTATADGGRR